jgi:hypothetical protein
VSISRVDMDDDEAVYAGDVTFVTAHEGEPPYLADVEQLAGNAVLSIDEFG